MVGVILMASGCLAVCTDLKEPAFVTCLQELGRWTAIAVYCAVVSITYTRCLDISRIVVSLWLFRRRGKELRV